MTTFSKQRLQLIGNQWSIDYRSIWDVLLSSIWTNIDPTVPWAFARWGGSTWPTVTLSCDLPVDQSKIFCRARSVCLRQRCGSLSPCFCGFKGSSVHQTLTLIWISLYFFNLVFDKWFFYMLSDIKTLNMNYVSRSADYYPVWILLILNLVWFNLFPP